MLTLTVTDHADQATGAESGPATTGRAGGAAGLHPWPEQVEALTALARALAVHDRAQLVMACGTGKTFVGRWHAQAADAQLTVVFLPSLALLAQTLGEWRRVAGWPFEALVVCSDPTTAAGAAERRNDDGDVDDVDEPYWAKVRAKVTTSPRETARFLDRKVPGRPQVVFSSYHSAPVLAAAQAYSGAVFDLAICDEAHRLAGRPRDEFRVVLDRRAIVARKRLFMTATPQFVDGEDTISMDDARVFGPVAHTISFGDAIAAGRLSDYQVLVVAGRPGDRVDDERRPGTLPAALLDAVDRHGIRRLLTFHGRNAKAAGFADLLDAVHSPAGNFVRAKHVHGQMPAVERAEILRWLGNAQGSQVRLVANARCLGEGIDVPAVDAVMFGDQRTSVIGIIQAVGRVLRPAPGKTRGTVIIPVVLPPDGDDDTGLTASAFGHVWAVLRGLRAHDQRLAEELDQAARTIVNGRMYAARASDRIQFVFPDGFSQSALQLRLVQEVGSMWEKFYLATEEWAWGHSGKRLPRNTGFRGIGIGEWAAKQRAARSAGLLPADRVARLEQIPGWYWDRDSADWSDTYAVLEAFAATHGTVTENDHGQSVFAGLYSCGANPRRLGVWAAQQRQLYRDGMLADDRVKLLEKLPGWHWDGSLAAEHVAMIQALVVFCEFEKHADVPEDHHEDGLPLGRWVWAIRRSKLLGQLPPALADEISAATPRGHKGAELFKWEQAESQWRLAYSALRQYARREGHAVPPASHTEQLGHTSVRVGQWASLQRFRHRHGELDERYVPWLEALPGWLWEVPLTTTEYGEPLDLGGHPHGTAKGIVAGCPCHECLDARRAYDRQRIANRRQLVDPVRAGMARHHIERLEAAGAKRSAIVAVSGVPLGVLRKVASGEWTEVERQHEQAILAVTASACARALSRVGSRGRLICPANERIAAGPTWAILDDLAERGFGRLWVSRELGYAGGLQIRRDVVTRRIADAIADLAERVGDLSYPAARNQRVPPLAELLAATNQPHARAS